MRARIAVVIAAALGAAALLPIGGVSGLTLPRTTLVSTAGGTDNSTGAYVSDDGKVVAYTTTRPLTYQRAVVTDRATGTTTVVREGGQVFGLGGDGHVVAVRGYDPTRVELVDRVAGTSVTFLGYYGLALASDGCHVLATKSGPNFTWEVVALSCDGTATPLTRADGPARTASPNLGGALSADGRYVAYVDDVAGAVRVEVATGAVEPLVGGNGLPGARGLSMSADGTRIAFQSFTPPGPGQFWASHTDIWVRDLVAGTVQHVYSEDFPGEYADRHPDLDATGRWVAYEGTRDLEAPDGYVIHLLDLQTWRHELVSTPLVAAAFAAYRPDVAPGGVDIVFDTTSALTPDDLDVPDLSGSTGADVYLRSRGSLTTSS